MKTRSHVIILCFILSLSQGFGQDIFSPKPELANQTSPNAFLVTQSGASSVRMQEVHSAGDFPDAPGRVFLITGISFSAPSWSGRVPIDVTLPNVQIRMSTTAKSPDGLSLTFADNVGPNETVVFSGSLHFFETEAEKYDLHIPITPFSYDAGAGNLLIDTFNYDTIFSRRDPDWTLDIAYRFGDSVSLLSGGINSPSGSPSTAGFMMRFTYTPVPEPSTWILLTLGVAGFGIARWKRKGAKV